jgi:hypothetical protein
LFGETTLPSFLHQHGNLFLAFTGGAAVATGLYRFFQRNKDDRGKIQLAVFHVVRILKDLPDLEERIQKPEELLETITGEVDRMIGTHLTRVEGAATVLKVKRKVRADLDARREKGEVMKRRRTDNATARDDDDAMSDRPVEDEAQFSEADSTGDVPEVLVQTPYSATDPRDKPFTKEELAQVGEKDTDVRMLDYESHNRAQAPTFYTSPIRDRPLPTSRRLDHNLEDSELPSSTPEQRTYEDTFDSDHAPGLYTPVQIERSSNPTPRRGRGGLYEDDDTPSPQSSRLACPRGNIISYDEDEEAVTRPTTPPRGQTTSYERADTPRPKTARRSNYGLGKQDHDTYFSPASWEDASPEREAPSPRAATSDVPQTLTNPHAHTRLKTAVKPRTTTPLLQPPSTLAVKTKGMVAGHWLPSVHEGRSPHVIPAGDVTQYRIAESRKLHGQLQEERKQRKLWNKWVPSIWQAPQEPVEENISKTHEEEEQLDHVQDRIDELLQQAQDLQDIAEKVQQDSGRKERQKFLEEEKHTREKRHQPASNQTNREEKEKEDEKIILEPSVTSPLGAEANPPPSKGTAPSSHLPEVQRHKRSAKPTPSPTRAARARGPASEDVETSSDAPPPAPPQTQVESKKLGRPRNTSNTSAKHKIVQTPGTRKSARVAQNIKNQGKSQSKKP